MWKKYYGEVAGGKLPLFLFILNYISIWISDEYKFVLYIAFFI